MVVADVGEGDGGGDDVVDIEDDGGKSSEQSRRGPVVRTTEMVDVI